MVWRSRGDEPQEIHESMNFQKTISCSLFWVGLIEKIMIYRYNSIHFPTPSHQWTYSPASLDLFWGVSVLPAIAEMALKMFNSDKKRPLRTWAKLSLLRTGGRLHQRTSRNPPWSVLAWAWWFSEPDAPTLGTLLAQKILFFLPTGWCL